MQSEQKGNLFHQVLAVLMESDRQKKLEQTPELLNAWKTGLLQASEKTAVASIPKAGIPESLKLVPPRKLYKRTLSTPEGKAVFLHAIVHIEFNAINLALDAVYRFQDMPDQFFTDWLEVAADEVRHFLLLEEYLHELGHEYGDFPVHHGLWEMAVKTDHDVVTRMGLVPRVLEARGLDVTPAMIDKFNGQGDERMAAMLSVILEEEIDHVRKGDYWFKWACRKEGEIPEKKFLLLVNKYVPGMLRGPYNHEARMKAGFSAEELAGFESGSHSYQ